MAALRVTQARILAAQDVHALLEVLEDSLQLNYVSACSALRRLAVFSRRGQAVPVADPRFLRLERLLSSETAGRLDSRGMGSAAWAAAVLRRPDLLDGMLSHAATQLSEASLQEHSLVAWAIGELKLGKQQDRCLRRVASASEALLDGFSPFRLALRVLRELPQAGSRPVGSRSQALRRLHTVNPHCMTRLLTGFASCGHALPRSLVDAIGREAHRQLRLFDAPGLSFFLQAHAQLGQRPNQLLLQAAPDMLASRMLAAGPTTSALALWSFARLRVHPGKLFLDACDASMAQAGELGLREVSTARLASAVWAWGALKEQPVLSWPAVTATLSKRLLRAGDKAALQAGLEQLASGEPPLDSDVLLRLASIGAAPHNRNGRMVRLPCRSVAQLGLQL